MFVNMPSAGRAHRDRCHEWPHRTPTAVGQGDRWASRLGGSIQRMSKRVVVAVDELAAAEPASGRLRDEHIAGYGELLSHVLFGDLTRWFVAHAPAAHVLDVLERHIVTGDARVNNLIAVSFPRES